VAQLGNIAQLVSAGMSSAAFVWTVGVYGRNSRLSRMATASSILCILEVDPAERASVVNSSSSAVSALVLWQRLVDGTSQELMSMPYLMKDQVVPCLLTASLVDLDYLILEFVDPYGALWERTSKGLLRRKHKPKSSLLGIFSKKI
jgi:hypothetical protein